MSCNCGNLDTIKILLENNNENNFDLLQTDFNGNNAFLHCCSMGYLNIIFYLLEFCPQSKFHGFHVKNKDKKNGFSVAFDVFFFQICIILLEFGHVETQNKYFIQCPSVTKKKTFLNDVSFRIEIIKKEQKLLKKFLDIDFNLNLQKLIFSFIFGLKNLENLSSTK